MFLLFPRFFPIFIHVIHFCWSDMVADRRTKSSPIKSINKAVITFLSKVVLRLLNQDQKLQFRKLEAITKKFSKLEDDIKYLNFCFDNQLLPKFTDFRLYDVSALNDDATIEFKKYLLLREIKKKEDQQKQCSIQSMKNVLLLKTLVKPRYFYACLIFLKRTLLKYTADVMSVHLNKLGSLFGCDVFLSEKEDRVITRHPTA